MSRVTITVDPAGHLVLPESVREEAGIVPGAVFEVTVVDKCIRLSPVEMPIRESSEAETQGAKKSERPN